MDEAESAFHENLINFPSEDSKEDLEITLDELNQIKEAMKDEQFRKLLNEYVEEVRDPNNQLTFQTETKQLEKERGNMVHFINPIAGYVLKTSVDGKKKAFVNICSNPLIKKLSFETATQDNKTGTLWSIPFSQSQGRDDMDNNRKSCIVYDVIFHPEALRMSKLNKVLQQKLEETALSAVEKSFKVTLDKKNIRKPKLRYKGMKIASTIKYKIGDPPPACIDPDQLEKELPPQADEVQSMKKNDDKKTENNKTSANIGAGGDEVFKKPELSKNHPSKNNLSDDSTVPIYTIKYRSYVDMQDYCIDNQRQGLSSKPIPDEVILIVDLPLLRDSNSLNADVMEDGWNFELSSDKTALYKLKLKLPFRVQKDSGKAIFDKDKRKLTITMKTVPKQPEYLFPKGTPPDDEDQLFGQLEEIPEHPPLDKTDSEESLQLERMTLSDSPPDESILSSSCSPGTKKSVSFSDIVQRQLYRSNSSILGQRKKNQRKAKNKKRSRERLNSGESVSSMDDEDGCSRIRMNSGGSVSSMDDESFMADLNDLEGDCLDNVMELEG